MNRLIFILLTVVILSGCSSFGTIEKDASLDSDKYSIFVLGLAPENYKVSVFPGQIKDGRFTQSIVSPAAVFGGAENGYIVGKAAAGTDLAITNIRIVKNKDSVYGPEYWPCKEAKTIAFTVPGGKVVYLGNVEYGLVDKKLNVKISRDLESARKYVDDNFPNLQGRLEQWDFQVIPTNEPCTRTIYVPIYTR